LPEEVIKPIISAVDRRRAQRTGLRSRSSVRLIRSADRRTRLRGAERSRRAPP